VIDAREVHQEIPELRGSCTEIVSFAEFCSFLTGDAVAPEAAALVKAAHALLSATVDHVARSGAVDETVPTGAPGLPQQLRSRS